MNAPTNKEKFANSRWILKHAYGHWDKLASRRLRTFCHRPGIWSANFCQNAPSLSSSHWTKARANEVDAYISGLVEAERVRRDHKNIFCFRCNASIKIDGDQFRDIHGRNGKPHCKKCAEKIDFDRLAKSIRFREMQNREWRLIYGFENERAITTVLADNATKAVELGRVELAKNPSRQWYLKKWKESGERVRPSYYGLEKNPVKIKINRCNWSGDETTLSYDPKTGAFEMSHLKGYVFWLERQNCCDEVTGAMFKIRGSQWRADDSLGQVWEGLQKCHYTAFSMGIERDADNPFVAAAQLLCNTI